MSLFKEVAYPGKYRDDNAIYDLVNYIMQPKKTQNEIVDGMHVADNDFAGSMVRVSERFHKNSGIRLRHFIVSFQRHEVKTLGVFICIGREICRYIGQEYQVVYALHLDTEYPHFHLECLQRHGRILDRRVQLRFRRNTQQLHGASERAWIYTIHQCSFGRQLL